MPLFPEFWRALRERHVLEQRRWLKTALGRLEERIAARVDRQEHKVHGTLTEVEQHLRAEMARRDKKTNEILNRLGDEQRAIRLLVQARTAGSPAFPQHEFGTQDIPSTAANAPEPESSPATFPDTPIEMEVLDRCPLCGSGDRTVVCEYNRFILLARSVDEALKRYDYCLCHACGMAYASHRPVGLTYRAMFDTFEDTLGRSESVPGRAVRTPLLTAALLTAEERAGLARRIAAGVFVSEHLEVSRKDQVPQLQADRLSNAIHLEILGSLLTLDRPRVLEIRSRFGSVSAGLRRLYRAEVHVLPMTDSQRFVIRQAYGIEADALLDFDRFTIPQEGRFDLIIANHYLTHALRPAQFLEVVRSRLVPGGHLYLYNEDDDAEILLEGISMMNINPFHMQLFDRRALTRALAANGLETVFVTRHEGQLVLLARAVEERIHPEMSEPERDVRLSAYLRARDAAILRLPDTEQWRFKDEWERVVNRGIASGVIAFDRHARLRIVKDPAKTAPFRDVPDSAVSD